jgi:hypothetical protein
MAHAADAAVTAGSDPEAAWDALAAEFDAWQAAGLTARLFWRDDDATKPGPALDRLLAVTAASAAPLMLTTIPADAADALAETVAAALHVAPVQHGWAHVNHARGAGGKGAWELGLHRGAAAVLADLERGQARLEELFGAAFVPAIVPPWNRIDDALFPMLAERGWRGVSAFGLRETARPVAGFTIANAHLDPFRWKEGARFAGAAKTLGILVGHLAAQRAGAADRTEALGFLTHHIDLDDAGWAFSERLGRIVAAHPAARWVGIADLFV